MGFHWVPAANLRAGDLLYWPGYSSFEGDVMQRDAAEAVAEVRCVGTDQIEVVMIVKSSTSGVVITLTGEYEADDLLPVVDPDVVERWIAEAVDDLTRL